MSSATSSYSCQLDMEHSDCILCLNDVNVSWEIQLIGVQDGDAWGLAQREDPAEAKRRGG